MSAMAETASDTIQIAASPSRVWEIAADVERNPDGVRDVKDVVVRSRDEQQRPSEVEFRASALGRSTHYTLAYDYSQAPDVLAWKMVKGDIQRSIEGAYHLTPTADGGTEVVETFDYSRYPWFGKAVIEGLGFPGRNQRGIEGTLQRLKAAAETDAARRA